MHRMFGGKIVLAALTLLGGGFAVATAEPDEAASIARARALFELLPAQRYGEFAAAGDEKVKASLNAQLAETIWNQLRTQLGEYKHEIGAKFATSQGYRIVNLTEQFERGKLTLRVVLNDKDQLSGFQVVGMDTSESFKLPDYADADKFREVDITVTTGEFKLPGKLTIPKGDGLFPAVVLVHGSGPNDMNEMIGPSQPFHDLAAGLSSRGIAVVRYDKRTHVVKQAPAPEDLTLEWETIDDAVSAVRLAQQRPEIDPQRVFVLGHSLGGMAAPYIAQQTAATASANPKFGPLAGLIIMAGSTEPVLDLIEKQVRYIANADGKIDEAEQAAIDQIESGIKSIRGGSVKPDENLLGAPAAYWAKLDQRRPAEVAGKLTLPMLVLQGGRDYQVTESNFAGWKQALGGHKNVTFKRFDNLNHLMIAGEGPSTPEEYTKGGHVDAAVVETVAKWVQHEGK